MEKKKLKELIQKNNQIIYDDVFFELLKETSLLEFRKNIQMVQDISPSLYLEQKVMCYYDELLQKFDHDTSLFEEYKSILTWFKNDNIQKLYQDYNFNYLVDKKLIIQLQDFCHYGDKLEKAHQYLERMTNLKVSEIIVDGLFGDTIYNVWINIKEMIRFHQSLEYDERVLTEEKLNFYKDILEIDNMNCKDKIKLYYRLKDTNIALMFYDDLRKIKELSYFKIKKQLFSVEENEDKLNLKESDFYSIPVYDLDGEAFYMLVRCIKHFSVEASYRRNCYTVIADYNMDMFSKKGFIYGYKNVNIEHILHLFEKDAYSSSKDSSNSLAIKFVNRVVSLEQLVGNHCYNEIQIVNKKNEDNNLYEVMYPDYLVVFDRIEDRHLEEAKRLGIPIVRINSGSYMERTKNELVKLSYQKIRDDYTDGSYLEENRLIRRLYKH